MKFTKSSRDAYVVVNLVPQPFSYYEPASDEMFDIEWFWDGVDWVRGVKNASTWDSFEGAASWARAILKSAEIRGRICVYKVCLETTIVIVETAQDDISVA